MFSGYLDKRVKVTSIQKVFNGRGGWTQKEVTLGEYWAAVFPLNVVERTQYSALNSDVTTKVMVRYNPDIKEDMFINFRGKKYRIQGVINPAYEDEYMQLVAVEAGAPVENTPALVTREEKVTFQGKTVEDGDTSKKIYFGVTYD